jgi:hypothetical protein
MRILGSLLIALLLVGCGTMKTTTEGDAIEKVDISTVADYDGEKIAVQVTSIDLTKLFELYPTLAEKNVGLGFAESVLDYLDETGRFIFTEEKSELKQKMVTQFKASKKGVFDSPINGKGKIKAARYFVYVTVADFAVDENEVTEGFKSKVEVITFIRLQVRFLDAETGQVRIASGEGESKKIGEGFLKSLDNMKFSQSTVGKASRKSLETATAKVVEKLIRDGVFEK